MKKKKKILVSITTTSNWPEKVKEIDELELKEVAIFPTTLILRGRKMLYGLLEKTKLVSIPHAHLRDDYESWELDYLTRKYKTEVFNIHPTKAAVEFIKNNRNYKDRIFLENLIVIPDNFSEILNQGGGVCLDLSHWEDFGVLQKGISYRNFEKILKIYKIGGNHISAIRQRKYEYCDLIEKINSIRYNDHYLRKLSELGYVKKYKSYLADIISIELENPLREQLKVKKYLKKILNL